MSQQIEKPSKPFKYYLAPFYVSILPIVIEIARNHGYAIGIHGSLARDLDLIAVPWVENCSDSLELIKEIKGKIEAVTTGVDWDYLVPDCEPTMKPHGRLAYSLHFTEKGCQGPYVDISVMPRLPKIVEKVVDKEAANKDT